MRKREGTSDAKKYVLVMSFYDSGEYQGLRFGTVTDEWSRGEVQLLVSALVHTQRAERLPYTSRRERKHGELDSSHVVTSEMLHHAEGLQTRCP